MNRISTNRYLWLGLMALVLLALLSLQLAPNSELTQGSTYSRSPDGYLAWYQTMTDRGVPLQRWQRSPQALIDQRQDADPGGEDEVTAVQTLIQVWPQLVTADWLWEQAWVQDWLAAGNRLIILGNFRPVTAAPFAQQLESPQGNITIETRRRHPHLDDRLPPILADDYGAVIWRETHNGGTIIFSTAPYLAANAYRSDTGNADLLSALVAETPGPIWIDEYLHGYRDADAIVAAVAGTWGAYLMSTPVLIPVLQVILIGVVLILAHNQRPGTRAMVNDRQVDNSQAYIQALSGVLHQAKSNPFVTTMIAKAEQLQLQALLGLGNTTLVDHPTLTYAWEQKTGQPADALAPLRHLPANSPPKNLPKNLSGQSAQPSAKLSAKPSAQNRTHQGVGQPMSDRQLALWLTQLQTIRRALGQAHRPD